MHGGDKKPQGQEKLIIWLLLALILSKYASCSIKDNWIPVILHLENDIDSSEHVSSLFGNNNLNGKSGPLTQRYQALELHPGYGHVKNSLFFNQDAILKTNQKNKLDSWIIEICKHRICGNKQINRGNEFVLANPIVLDTANVRFIDHSTFPTARAGTQIEKTKRSSSIIRKGEDDKKRKGVILNSADYNRLKLPIFQRKQKYFKRHDIRTARNTRSFVPVTEEVAIPQPIQDSPLIEPIQPFWLSTAIGYIGSGIVTFSGESRTTKRVTVPSSTTSIRKKDEGAVMRMNFRHVLRGV